MSHAPDHIEASPEITLPSEQAAVAIAARNKFSTEYVNEVLPSGQTSNPTDQNAQAQALLQQGLKDLGAGNSANGILELMTAAQQSPSILQNKDLVTALHAVYRESEPHQDHFTPATSGPMDVSQQGLLGTPQRDAEVKPGGNGQSTSDAGTGNQVGAVTDQQAQQGRQLAQQGLSDIASGKGASGIMELMQAAQLDPSILKDSRFAAALQMALAQAGNIKTASQ
ncbi:MAG: hypothetical protein K2X29_14000 [Candidatus Obscuribacterales bacterium]|nr:hypothetical protein [Candidatus Obscuribacterales bacterium]